MTTSAAVFATLAAVFIGVCLYDFLRAAGALTPARRTWLRVAFIFAGVAIALNVVPLLRH
jgi:hypothetical protein